MWRFVFLICVFAASSLQADYVEPKRGSYDRKGMLDALRPRVEWMLGMPVEFVVHDARLAEGQGLSRPVGFVSVTAQRPGGTPIDMRKTPGFARGQIDPEYMDGSTSQALLMKVGKTWVAVHWALGATDAWYTAAEFCEHYFAVLPEACGG
ncbi:hypothetical protein N4R57_05390 [Rhodobacteraceae bacterium D3-12]|nr:hypothetical protein N4R57_05390 [Rhodobacteraceae bacterium D3-12]